MEMGKFAAAKAKVPLALNLIMELTLLRLCAVSAMVSAVMSMVHSCHLKKILLLPKG